ncbi:hypothetical protein ACFSC6_12155 [Rufibacter sediminis]|uniref:hypothetical protein n=1 Tax=Rufibacter sediminis TaxID=2762756 RepID=UPI00210F0C5B|nr:hypothetical protein [Rufibacter sediminis]
MIYSTGTCLFAGYEFKQAVDWSRENKLTQDDVKILKNDWQVLVIAKRDVEI